MSEQESGLLPERLRIGTSSWSAPSWKGVFYPDGVEPAGFLGHYARHFDTVEIDATFYRIPAARMVDNWRERTPEGFLFAAKVPQVITHEKLLEECRDEMNAFLKVMDRLEERLGPLLFQFRYFRKAEFPDPGPFIDRLERFLPTLPAGRQFVVEVRNKNFVVPRLLDLLRKHGIALAWIDHPWFYRVDDMVRRPETLTADFSYIRWLGDRHGIERKTKSWDKVIVDRSRHLRSWIAAIRGLMEQPRTVYGYFNNHYAGYAVGSIHQFREMWEAGESGAS
jgi:uncharacterized protein YecE (DUF72 family)